uniref:Transmembrane protein n=1 Tax=Zooxanthella nutricula TaxID=1333877 RepID=A0A7S2LGM1_9DINO
MLPDSPKSPASVALVLQRDDPEWQQQLGVSLADNIDVLDNGFLAWWPFRVATFYGYLFSCFAVICVRIAAIPTHVLFFTGSDQPGFWGIATFFQFQWLLCYHALVAQVLWNFMASMVAREKPLRRFRCALARRLAVQVVTLDAGMLLAFLGFWLVYHKYWAASLSDMDPLVSLFGAVYVFAQVFAAFHEALRLLTKLKALRTQALSEWRADHEGVYRGFCAILIVLLGQVMVALLSRLVMAFSVRYGKVLVVAPSIVALVVMMWAFARIFASAIEARSRLLCECMSCPGCGSFFSIVCAIAFALLTVVYVCESPILQGLIFQPDSRESPPPLLTGGRMYDPHHMSLSESKYLGS